MGSQSETRRRPTALCAAPTFPIFRMPASTTAPFAPGPHSAHASLPKSLGVTPSLFAPACGRPFPFAPPPPFPAPSLSLSHHPVWQSDLLTRRPTEAGASVRAQTCAARRWVARFRLPEAAGLALRLEQGEDVSLTDGALHVAHDQTVLVVQELDANLSDLRTARNNEERGKKAVSTRRGLPTSNETRQPTMHAWQENSPPQDSTLPHPPSFMQYHAPRNLLEPKPLSTSLLCPQPIHARLEELEPLPPRLNLKELSSRALSRPPSPPLGKRPLRVRSDRPTV